MQKKMPTNTSEAPDIAFCLFNPHKTMFLGVIIVEIDWQITSHKTTTLQLNKQAIPCLVSCQDADWLIFVLDRARLARLFLAIMIS